MSKERNPASSPLPAEGALDRILDGGPFARADLIGLLHRIQAECGHIPREAVVRLSERLGLTEEEIASVVTFYRAFSFAPRGGHRITVCTGTACHVRGARRVVDECRRILGIEPGGTTPDGVCTLETVNCVGACALGPIVIADGATHGHMNPGKAADLVAEILSEADEPA
ncbi:MAG: NAD(P)H-dependent oxidoreductase subunit E [Candidatus Aminicenantes bacterium]|nr:NAD(P)H-dependent oxidoreductase subunit E [Candidatus Aminicenantes bacterium]